MTPPEKPYGEDALVQQPMADALEQLGWRQVNAFAETLGAGGTLGRESEREVILAPVLREKLVALNPGLPDEAYDDAIRQLTEMLAGQDIVKTNRRMHEIIIGGAPVEYRDSAGESRRENLRVIDFDNPDNNDFLCAREVWVRGDLYRRRADIVGFVNGLPLLFVECKGINRHIKEAYDGNYSDYKDTVPALFYHNAVVMFSNGETGKVGSVTSEWEHFHEWKRLKEGDAGAVDMETMVKGVCSRANFLDIVENFIVFDESAGAPRKILARNHQYLGVNAAVESLRNRAKRKGRLGVFWHTQGAGKSYSMVMFARKAHRRLPGNFTFVVLTDREDLDRQIYRTFAGCALADNDSDQCRAESGADLRDLLSQNKRFVFSLIQKFNRQLQAGECYTNRNDVIVIADEAHRSHYDSLGQNMRDALPNAAFIGFTGTPLFKQDEITRRVFGDYVSTYDFQRAVDDGATVPLYYDARGEALNVALDDINERIAEKLEEFEIEDINVTQRLESELQRDYHIITAQRRLEQVARDFVEHYSNAWQTGKAMLVCIDKITCVKMHELIERCWGEKITALEEQLAQRRAALAGAAEVVDEAATEEAAELAARIEWMRETRRAVVVSEEQGEVEKFRNWGLDITPHRKLIKDGMELPDEMRNRPEYANSQRMTLDDTFKAPEHPFRVAIVCAMWLTGFDVPCLSTLYLDKPLRAHTLMQAIARANRVYEGKNNGMVVDYCGILTHLRRALATFAGVTAGGAEGAKGAKIDPTKPREELLRELAQALRLVEEFFDESDTDASLHKIITTVGGERVAAIVECKEAANAGDEARKRFEILCRQVFRKYKACINLPDRAEHRPFHDATRAVYKSLQNDRERADISDIIRELHGIVDDAIAVGEGGDPGERKPFDISKIDFKRLAQEFKKVKRGQHTITQNMRSAIEKRLRRLLAQNPMRANFQQRYEEIVRAYNDNKDSATIERAFAELLKLAGEMSEEEKRAADAGLSEEQLAVFDLLSKPEMSKREIKQVKAVAVSLLAKLKGEALQAQDWREREQTRAAVRVIITDALFADMPEKYADDESKREEMAAEIYRHISRAYPQLPSPVYG